MDIYKNRKTVALTLRDSDRVLSKLSVLSGFLFGAIALLVSLTMLDVEVFLFLRLLGPLFWDLHLLLAQRQEIYLKHFSLFLLLDHLKCTTRSNLMMVTVSRSCQLAFSTQLLRSDGAIAYMPTSQLSQARIYNITRGKNFGSVCDFVRPKNGFKSVF